MLLEKMYGSKRVSYGIISIIYMLMLSICLQSISDSFIHFQYARLVTNCLLTNTMIILRVHCIIIEHCMFLLDSACHIWFKYSLLARFCLLFCKSVKLLWRISNENDISPHTSNQIIHSTLNGYEVHLESS